LGLRRQCEAIWPLPERNAIDCTLSTQFGKRGTIMRRRRFREQQNTICENASALTAIVSLTATRRQWWLRSAEIRRRRWRSLETRSSSTMLKRERQGRTTCQGEK
jgi:hypothetical protein